MSSIYDVAKRAGVSPITVSRVINNSGYVGKDTRLRVEQAVRELSFVPNALARSLKARRTNTIGLLVTDITNPFFTSIVRGVEDVAQKNDLSVIICNTDEDVQKERAYLHMLQTKRVDGLLIAPASSISAHLVTLSERKLPFVLLDRTVETLRADIVRGDSVSAAEMLVDHMVSLGQTRIGFLNGPLSISTARERLLGYQKALERHGLPFEPEIVAGGSYKTGGGYRQMLKVMAAAPLPRAIIAANNSLAIGALLALRERGLRVPADTAIACFDDTGAASLIEPFLTCAAFPAYRFGTEAAGLLIDRLGGATDEAREVLLPAELLIRRSCGTPFTEQELELRELQPALRELASTN